MAVLSGPAGGTVSARQKRNQDRAPLLGKSVCNENWSTFVIPSSRKFGTGAARLLPLHCPPRRHCPGGTAEAMSSEERLAQEERESTVPPYGYLFMATERGSEQLEKEN